VDNQENSRTRSGLVILLTICVGFLPMLISALVYGTFTFNNLCDLPLLAYTSILVGDLILLPIFNAVFLNAVILLRKKINGKRKMLTIGIFCSAIFSIIFNYYTHFFLWSQDTITSFMDTTKTLTVPGYIHFVYSTMQTAVVFVFLFLVFFMLSPKIKNAFQGYARKLSLLLFLFSSLSIPDFCIRNFYVNRQSLVASLTTDFSSLVIFPVMLIFFLAVFAVSKGKIK